MLGLTMQCVIQLQFSAKKQKPLKKELLLDLYSYHTQGQAHGQFLGIGSTLFCLGPALGNLRNDFFSMRMELTVTPVHGKSVWN